MLIESQAPSLSIGGIPFTNAPVGSEQIEGIFLGELATLDGPAPAIFFRLGSSNTVVWLFTDEAARDTEYLSVKTAMAGGGSGGDLAALTSLIAQMSLNNDELEPKLDLLHSDNELIRAALNDLAPKLVGIGQPEDPPASSDIASTSLLAHVKRLSAKFGAKGRQTANESISVVQASDAPPTVVRSGASASTFSLALQVGSAATFDTADFAGICFDFAGFATSQVLTVEACNTENGTFRAVQVRNLATGALTTTINAVGLYQLLTVARYVRLRVSTAGSNGVTSGTAFCKALAAA